MSNRDDREAREAEDAPALRMRASAAVKARGGVPRGWVLRNHLVLGLVGLSVPLLALLRRSLA